MPVNCVSTSVQVRGRDVASVDDKLFEADSVEVSLFIITQLGYVLTCRSEKKGGPPNLLWDGGGLRFHSDNKGIREVQER